MTAIPAGPIRLLYTVHSADFTFMSGTLAMYDGRGRATFRLAPGMYYTVLLTVAQRTRGIQAASMAEVFPVGDDGALR